MLTHPVKFTGANQVTVRLQTCNSVTWEVLLCDELNVSATTHENSAEVQDVDWDNACQ